MMKQDEIASYYRQVSATGANPAGMVVKLYDRILEDFRRALEAIAANDIKGRVASLNHALLIIAEMDSVLDFERGGIIAQHLRGFYNVTRSLIVEANARTSSGQIKKLTDLYMPLRQAWQQVEQDVAQQKIKLPEDSRSAEPLPRPAAKIALRTPVMAGSEPDGNGSHWNA
ncbi:MAG TPA: flagellar export chaperone FliS [Candidatus Acidoferrum sp.]|nr:flagellar export chaperone FliS [Candidatus Acidoferrum sp.]